MSDTIPATPTPGTGDEDARLVRRALETEVKLREATLDLYQSLGLYTSRDLQFAVSDIAGIPGNTQVQPPWYQQNTKRGEVIPVYRTEQELRLIQDRMRVMANYNEFTICALENRINYVVGDGLKYAAAPVDVHNAAHRASAEAVQEVIDTWVELNDAPAMEAEALWRLDTEGEAIIRGFRDSSGYIHERFVEPEHLRPSTANTADPVNSFGVITDREDVQRIKGYWIVDDPLNNPEPSRVDVEKVVHLKLNVRSSAKRGLPTFFPVEANLKRCEDLLASMTSMAKARAKIALIRKITGLTSSTADSLLSKLSAIRANDPATGETLNIERLRYGTILTASGNTEYDMPAVQLGASDIVEVLQAELRAVASRLQMPEWMFTALADAKYSNAFIVEAPTLKSFRRLQRLLRNGFGLCRYGHRKSLLWRQLEAAVDAGLLASDDLDNVVISCEGPTLEARDRMQEVERHKELVAGGFESKETAQRQLELDPDHEKPLISAEQVGKARPVADANAVSQIQEAFYAGKLPRDAAAANLMILLSFTREQAEALLPASDCVKRTDDGQQPGQPGAPGGAAPGDAAPGDSASGNDRGQQPGGSAPGSDDTNTGDTPQQPQQPDPADELLMKSLTTKEAFDPDEKRDDDGKWTSGGGGSGDGGAESHTREVGKDFPAEVYHGTIGKSAAAFESGSDLPERDRSTTLSEFGSGVIYSSEATAPHQALMFGSGKSEKGARKLVALKLKPGAKILDLTPFMVRRAAVGGSDADVLKIEKRPPFTDDLKAWLQDARVSRGRKPLSPEDLDAETEPGSKGFDPKLYAGTLAAYARARGYAAFRLSDETVIVDRSAVVGARPVPASERRELEKRSESTKHLRKQNNLYTDTVGDVYAKEQAAPKPRSPLTLREAGFTGAVTAKNGVTYHYVDGKRVAAEEHAAHVEAGGQPSPVIKDPDAAQFANIIHLVGSHYAEGDADWKTAGKAIDKILKKYGGSQEEWDKLAAQFGYDTGGKKSVGGLLNAIKAHFDEHGADPAKVAAAKGEPAATPQPSSEEPTTAEKPAEPEPPVNLDNPAALGAAATAAAAKLRSWNLKQRQPGDFLPHNVPLRDIYDALQPGLGGATFPQFKDAVVKSFRAGKLQLEPIDMRTEDAEQNRRIQSSEVMGGAYHAVSVPTDYEPQPEPQPEPDAEPASGPPPQPTPAATPPAAAEPTPAPTPAAPAADATPAPTPAASGIDTQNATPDNATDNPTPNASAPVPTTAEPTTPNAPPVEDLLATHTGWHQPSGTRKPLNADAIIKDIPLSLDNKVRYVGAAAHGYVTNMKVLVKVPNEKMQAKINANPRVQVAQSDPKVADALENIKGILQKAQLNGSSTPASVAAERVGDGRDYMLEDADGRHAFVDASYHDTVLAMHPGATAHLPKKPYTPVVYRDKNGEPIGVVQPLMRDDEAKLTPEQIGTGPKSLADHYEPVPESEISTSKEATYNGRKEFTVRSSGDTGAHVTVRQDTRNGGTWSIYQPGFNNRSVLASGLPKAKAKELAAEILKYAHGTEYDPASGNRYASRLVFKPKAAGE